MAAGVSNEVGCKLGLSDGNVLIDLRSSPEKPALKNLAEHQTVPLSATAPPSGRLGKRNGEVVGKNTLSHRNPRKSFMISEFRTAS